MEDIASNSVNTINEQLKKTKEADAGSLLITRFFQVDDRNVLEQLKAALPSKAKQLSAGWVAMTTNDVISSRKIILPFDP